MTTIRTGKSTNTYKRYTPAQLASTIRTLQNYAITVSKKPTWTTIKGKTVVQTCNAVVSETRKIATVLRGITVQQINVKIRGLKSQMAHNLGVKFSSPKTNTGAVKRLKAKLKQIKQCKRISTLAKICTGVRLSTYKNPSVPASVRAKGTSTRRYTTSKSARGTRRTTRSIPHTHVAKFKRQTKSLKKQVNKLQKRNSFMRRLVNQFRRKVAKLKRSYRAANAQPRWKVVGGRGPSNVVRFRTRTSAWNRQAQRRVG